ncbi:hypothetical protein BGX34_006227, partial [Mortierella sp. NVP85]
MSSKHVDTTKQPIMVLPEHLKWALIWNGKEHVTFPAFVNQFRFYNKMDAHHAFCRLLDSGKIRQQRLKAIRVEYERFKNNSEDLFWSRRLKDKSTTIVLNSASIIVQEGSLTTVDSNVRRHLSPDYLKSEDNLLYGAGAAASEEGNDDEVVASVSKTS